ncbi:sensor histidine kinase [Paenibacillus soyae]|uniref:histidine kinase n=1 Tax=Paenibacillus soyae TaxID=2969249 RepID=A0A9X2MLT1_9BACL|nr:HAMP domain-containing sensor histidine kinase [Paenibacillus soyae]MCR2802412.1 HAMP domain-containing histidine kinase [Paenibacillus soyae]
MSIRLRLLFSFASVVIVSIVLFLAAAYLLSVAVTGDARSFGSFYRIHYAIHPLSEEEENIFLELKYLAKHDPERLLDENLLQDFDLQLKMVQSGLIVRRNDNIVYATPTLREEAAFGDMPAYEMGNYSIRNTMNLGSRFFSYAKFDFYFSESGRENEKGSVFVLRERSPFAQLVRTLLPILIAVFLVILLLTGLLLYRYVTRTIVKPLDRLRRSAEGIKEGDLSIKLEPSSNDEVGQLVMSFEDMRGKLEQSVQLQLRYEENRKQLLSNISHDLRTPITTIKGYAEGIRDGLTDTKEKLDRYVGAIHTRASDLEKLVGELLYYSKLDMNKEPYSFEQVELYGFLHAAVGEMAIELEQLGVKVHWEERSSAPAYAMADREKLRRVVSNLLGNCLKYMPRTQDEKRIDIGLTEEPDGFFAVRISDNGHGIPDEALPHIFERFYRAEPSRSMAAGGSGLGLAIAKQIIEGHGGAIRAESSVSQGTTICFTLQSFEDHRQRQVGNEP